MSDFSGFEEFKKAEEVLKRYQREAAALKRYQQEAAVFERYQREAAIFQRYQQDAATVNRLLADHDRARLDSLNRAIHSSASFDALDRIIQTSKGVDFAQHRLLESERKAEDAMLRLLNHRQELAFIRERRRHPPPPLQGHVRLVQWLPLTAASRKNIIKLIADEQAAIVDLRQKDQRVLARWRTYCVSGHIIYYALRWPFAVLYAIGEKYGWWG